MARSLRRKEVRLDKDSQETPQQKEERRAKEAGERKNGRRAFQIKRGHTPSQPSSQEANIPPGPPPDPLRQPATPTRPIRHPNPTPHSFSPSSPRSGRTPKRLRRNLPIFPLPRCSHLTVLDINSFALCAAFGVVWML